MLTGLVNADAKSEELGSESPYRISKPQSALESLQSQWDYLQEQSNLLRKKIPVGRVSFFTLDLAV